jgi:hypothetical protein
MAMTAVIPTDSIVIDNGPVEIRRYAALDGSPVFADGLWHCRIPIVRWEVAEAVLQDAKAKG